MGKLDDIRIGPRLSKALARLCPLAAPLLSEALAHARFVAADGESVRRWSIAAPSSSSPGVDLSAAVQLSGSWRGTRDISPTTLPIGDSKAIANKLRDINYSEWLDNLYPRFSGGNYSNRTAWTAANFIALAKLFFKHADHPERGVLFASKNLLDLLQDIDWGGLKLARHACHYDPDTGITYSRVGTLYGDIDIVHESALDRINYGVCGALIDPSRLVRYAAPPAESEGGIVLRQTLDLNGYCHVWIGSHPYRPSISIPISNEAYNGDNWD